MSDNDRRNSREIKQDHEHHDPLEKLTQIFNPNKQDANQHDQSSQTDPSASQFSKTSSHDDDFDLSFLEAKFENHLTNDPSLDDQRTQWNSYTTSNKQNAYTTQNAFFSSSEQNKFLSEEESSSSPSHDEEQILDALSPLPIQKNQSSNKGAAPINDDSFSEKSDFSMQTENFFLDEVDIHRKSKKPVEQTNHFSQTNVQQSSISNIQQNYNDTPVNHSYIVSADQENWVEEYYTNISPHPTDENTFFSSSDHILERENTIRNEETKGISPHTTQIDKPSDVKEFTQSESYEEKFLKQETYAERTQKYPDIHAQYINNTEKISKEEVSYNQSDLNEAHSSSESFNTKQEDSFFAHNYTHRDTPPPNVDTYKFAEEIVEKTGTITVPEITYETPEYDIQTDGFKEEFSEILNVGNVREENFSQKQQESEIFHKIFHQTMQDLGEDAYRDFQEQNANYFPTDNTRHHSSSFTEDSLHKGADNIPPHAPPPSFLRSFIVGKTFTKSIVLLILIAIGFAGYSYLFMSPQKNENVPIIHADNTPFKFKQETTETENDVAHNLDIYKQTTEENDKQENTQQFLIDNSEQPENLVEVNQQGDTDSSSSSLNETDVEDAINGAIDHTIPTREVQTVVVNQDGTIVLAPKHHTEKEVPNELKETINQTTEDQFQDSSPISSYDSDTNNNETSDTNNNETEDNLTHNIDKIIAENASHVEEKFIPIPSRAERSSELQTHDFSHQKLANQTDTENSESYYVQLSSQPTHALARDSLKKMQSKFGSLIGVRPLNIQSALIPGKGIYYRIRIQTQNRNDAISLCEDIKSFGGNCFITR
ncbi:hypothetical protein ABID39_000606 [Bartonella japonica]|uniref:SPOR domain-containing protein n=1 Tax=Bartonella japonica TaxID=357761 RepID=A0ABV2FMY7_9HYPH